jgi:hypothetical protein
MTTGIGDFPEIFRLWISIVPGFRDDDVEVPQIFDFMAKFDKVLVQVRVPERGWPHIHAASIRAKVHWNTKNGNLRHGDLKV